MRLSWAALLLCTAHAIVAQPPVPTYIGQTEFSTGQDVVPVYEGWLPNSDGTFTMVFGYFNRNWKEELAIPAGPENKLEPGDPDRGQPTYFLPRRQMFTFRVQVPKDWGQQELVWVITAHGRTEKAYGQLTPEEEISERMTMTRGNLSPGEDDPNKPPSVSIAPVSAASVASPLSLTALVSDDGLPKPRPAPKPRPGTQSDRPPDARPRGLTVTWSQYRGPAKVAFEPAGPIAVADGKGITTAHFSEPGLYVLRATASDGALQTRDDITITVTGTPPVPPNSSRH
jgi:hypothetical protein